MRSFIQGAVSALCTNTARAVGAPPVVQWHHFKWCPCIFFAFQKCFVMVQWPLRTTAGLGTSCQQMLTDVPTLCFQTSSTFETTKLVPLSLVDWPLGHVNWPGTCPLSWRTAKFIMKFKSRPNRFNWQAQICCLSLKLLVYTPKFITILLISDVTSILLLPAVEISLLFLF